MNLTIAPKEGGTKITFGTEKRITEPFAQVYMAAEWIGADPPGDKTHGRLTARNPLTGEIAWEKRYDIIPHSALLTTGGGLLFNGTYDGFVEAIDAKTGEVLWRFNNGSGHNGGIVSYESGGKQYIGVVVGHGSYVGRALVEQLPQREVRQYEGKCCDRCIFASVACSDESVPSLWLYGLVFPVGLPTIWRG